MRFAPRNLLHFFPLFFLIRPALRVHIGEQRTERKVEGERERERKRERDTPKWFSRKQACRFPLEMTRREPIERFARPFDSFKG